LEKEKVRSVKLNSKSAAPEAGIALGTSLLPTANARFAAYVGNAALIVILLLAGSLALVRATITPFWYDEICTIIVSSLPSVPDIWSALHNSADGNPPVYYYLVRLALRFVPDNHIASRLPSILGLLGTIFAIYIVLSRRVDRLSALVGAALILCTAMVGYGHEARPYALMTGSLAGAIVFWQQLNVSRLSSFFLTLTLAAAVSLHYYALLGWPAFILAEAAVWKFHRRFRVGAWGAFGVGAVPLLFFSPLILQLRQYYGPHLWSYPEFKQMFSSYNFLFNFNGYGGWVAATFLTLVCMYWYLGKTISPDVSRQRLVVARALPIEECVLAVALLLTPVIAVLFAKASGGGMTDRYMVPTVLGGCLAVGFIVSRAPSALRVLLLMLMLVSSCFSSITDAKALVSGSRRLRVPGVDQLEAIFARSYQTELPIVISSGMAYLEIAYYESAEINRNLYTLVDPDAAVKFAGTDSVDLNLMKLRQYFPLQVEKYGEFSSRHREFLLVSFGGRFDWWSARLSSDRHALMLISEELGIRVYKVTVRP
jgi:hypothetical protein